MAQERGPSSEDWERMKPLIRQLYLIEGRTCKEVVEELKKYDGFAGANDRKLKSRLKPWGYELKRISGECYLAMQSICNHRRSRGQDTYFDVSRRLIVRKEVTANMVKKEVDRLKDAVIPDLETAKATLATAEIRYGCVPRESRMACDCGDVSCYQRMMQSTENAAPDRQYDSDETVESGNGTPHNYSDSDDGYDFTDAMRKTDLDDPPHPVVIFKRSQETWYDLKGRVTRWAAPYYLQSRSEASERGTFELKKRAGMETLRYMLKSDADNRYIFPCLSWMVLILGSNEKFAELNEFLTASCAVIDQEMGPDSITYAVPFHYALAKFTGDEAGVAKYGELFPRAYAQLRQLYGDDHPNVLVSVYFWAYHTLELQRFDDVFSLLKDFLPLSERVMGRYDLLTINCLVILSRAHLGRQDYPTAATLLESAIERIDSHKPELQMMRNIVVQRLAKTKMEMDDRDAAETKLRQVLEGRVHHLGLESGATWFSLEQLVSFLHESGRADEAARIYEDMKARLDRQRDREWHYENGLPLPPDLRPEREPPFSI